MAFGSVALKSGTTALYALEFFCAAIVLGIYSYFLSVEADRNVNISMRQRAVTGLSGAVVLYTILAVLLTCFLGGKTIFALLGILFDLLCCGAMVAIIIFTRDGAHKCSGNVRSPLGNGPSSSRQGFGSNDQGRQITYAVSLGTACRLNTACFAVAILGALLFLITALLQCCLSRNHKKEKAFSPSPTNGHTKRFGAKRSQRNYHNEVQRDPEVAAIPLETSKYAAPVARHDHHPSNDTAFNGSTVAASNTPYEPHTHTPGNHRHGSTGTYLNKVDPPGEFHPNAYSAVDHIDVANHHHAHHNAATNY